MIERIFFISENTFPSGDLLPPEENIYYSILADPQIKGSLEEAYALIGHATSPLALTLEIREPLTAESLRFVTSFLFIPSYLTLEHRPVINLTGDSPELLRGVSEPLSAYLSLQGIREPIFHTILAGEPAESNAAGSEQTPLPEGNWSFRSVEALGIYYRGLLQNDQGGYKNIFFYAASEEILRAAFLSLQQAEMDFIQEAPQLYSFISSNRRLEKELYILSRKYISTETELNHQKQYIDILRSNHATKELQNYYHYEYEILPLWYKRLGHIIKVITGKRTFRSLFRNDVKKYKD